MDGRMLHYLGQACRAARERAGLLQIDIATTAGTSHATISRLETGRSWPTEIDRVVAAYAEETGVASRQLPSGDRFGPEHDEAARSSS